MEIQNPESNPTVSNGNDSNKLDGDLDPKINNLPSDSIDNSNIINDVKDKIEETIETEQNDNQDEKKKSSQDEFIDKLADHVQAYINQCFEMDIDSLSKPKSPEPSTNNKVKPKPPPKPLNLVSDRKQHRLELAEQKTPTTPVTPSLDAEEPPPVAILDVNEQSHQNVDEAKPSASNQSGKLPIIHITNEYGQESITMENNTNQEPSAQTQPQRKKVAVVVKNVSFAYKKKTPVLSNINMIVPKAQIFALLGSSGCGKTTLLRIILGRLSPKKGEVKVFGAKPGSVHSNIPGSGVGFMPQELALFPSFTIEETLYYFGLLHHIPKDDIAKRTDFMIDLLNLPPKNRKIEQCSGGQQRRASIALTLFHSPPLLILDEPTVGVDPLLRLKIWQYLEYLCVNNRMTIIITTHYIEESRRANSLAFMRFGRILTQDSPDNLLTKYNKTVLEDVYLILCQQDCGEIKQKHSVKKKDYVEQTKEQQEEDGEPLRSKYYNFSIDSIRMKALFFKNLISVKRNPLLFFFFLLLPVIQTVLFCISVFKSPDNIAVSVYNADGRALSKRFLSYIDEALLSLNHANSLEEAIRSVEQGKSWAAIGLEKNFSLAYRRRAKNPSDLSDEDFDNSKIKLYTDQTDNFMFSVFDNSLLSSYQKFVENVAESFGYNPATVKLPLYVKEVMYGELQLDKGYVLLDNLISSSLIAIIYSTPLLMSAMVIVMERKDHVIERTFVNGATSLEVFLTHIITLMISLFIQVFILLFVTMVMFDVTMLGSLGEVFLLLYMQGLLGILIGLLISSIAKNEVVALLLSLGMVFPIWMTAGVFWPLESIDQWLQNIFWVLPLTYPIRSTAHVFKRGWNYEYYEVMMGHVSSAIYNTVLFFMNIFIFHFTSK